MTNSVNYPKQQAPTNYSGITIHITNPTLNANPNGVTPANNEHCNCPSYQQAYGQNPQYNQYANPQYGQPQGYMQPPQITQDYYQGQVYNGQNQNNTMQREIINNTETIKEIQNAQGENYTNNSYVSNPQQANPQSVVNQQPQVYPAQYYMNTYNLPPAYPSGAEQQAQTVQATTIPANMEQEPSQIIQQVNPQAYTQPQIPVITDEVKENPYLNNIEEKEEDMSTSTEIISDLDARVEAEKVKEENSKKTRIIALTNEYIMSLENYLNNPNKEIRVMAAKEILTRLDEDKDRFDDAALNALINKMLQDPDKIIRVAAMSALSGNLASGNEYTVKLLKDIQANPRADKDDAVEAANILLMMSASTDIRYVPNPQTEQGQAGE